MENEYPESIVYPFLADKQLKTVFAKIDYALRSGIHIQRESAKPEEIFRFLERHFESLSAYYNDIFRLSLERCGESYQSRYYFLDFENDQNRSMIPSDNKYKRYLETGHIIIGMIFLKMYKLDANIELNSIEGFIRLLFAEYEDEKKGLFRLVAGAKNDKSSDYLEHDVVKEIHEAFAEFEKLGWIVYTDDEKIIFKYMPSFDRLRKKYEPQILSIDDIIKELEDEN